MYNFHNLQRLNHWNANTYINIFVYGRQLLLQMLSDILLFIYSGIIFSLALLYKNSISWFCPVKDLPHLYLLLIIKKVVMAIVTAPIYGYITTCPI